MVKFLTNGALSCCQLFINMEKYQEVILMETQSLQSNYNKQFAFYIDLSILFEIIIRVIDMSKFLIVSRHADDQILIFLLIKKKT